MKLKRITLFVIITISYSFILRAFGTFIPGLFCSPVIAKTIQLLLMISDAAILLFFIYFRREYVKEEQRQLKNAAVLSIVGMAAILLVQVKNFVSGLSTFMAKVFQFSPYLFRLLKTSFADAFIPFAASIFVLIFFILFYKTACHGRSKRLSRALLFAIIGASFAVLLRVYVLVTSIIAKQIMWFTHYPMTISILLTPILFITFAANLYFLIVFYKELGKN
ncbi:hypothetical protein JXI42_06230 [bacterium]|nr:hypothetical protein [bacterium]